MLNEKEQREFKFFNDLGVYIEFGNAEMKRKKSKSKKKNQHKNI